MRPRAGGGGRGWLSESAAGEGSGDGGRARQRGGKKMTETARWLANPERGVVKQGYTKARRRTKRAISKFTIS